MNNFPYPKLFNRKFHKDYHAGVAVVLLNLFIYISMLLLFQMKNITLASSSLLRN